MPLNDVTILITSFLRPGLLTECLKRIKAYLPECPCIVVDDSNIPMQGVTIQLPFDVGLTVKRNAGVQATKTKYVLIGSDDFNFDAVAHQGILKMLDVLEHNPDTDLAAGRHNNLPYEGFLDYVPGSHIKETRLDPDGKQLFYQVDLTVNYFIARTETLRQIPWDETIVPIGGEHGDFFLSLKEAHKKVVWIPGVNINSLPFDSRKQHPNYDRLRGRAKSTGHQIFLKKRGIDKYYGFEEPIIKSDIPNITVLANPETIHAPNPQPLIAIITCHRYADRAEVQRKTWIAEVKGADYKFFLGKGPNPL